MNFESVHHRWMQEAMRMVTYLEISKLIFDVAP